MDVHHQAGIANYRVALVHANAMKLRHLFPLLLALPMWGQALPQCYPDIAGHDVHNLCVGHGADPDHPVATWTTTTPRTSIVEYNVAPSAPPQTSDTDPSFNYFVANNSLVTSHSVIIPVASNWSIGFAAGGCTATPCARLTSTFQASPYTSNVTNAYLFTSDSPNPAHSFSATVTMNGPPQTNSMYQGHGYNLSINELQVDGPVPNNIVVTHLDIDGTNCTVALAGGTCGASGHITTQYIEANDEIISPTTNNYHTVVTGAVRQHWRGARLRTVVPAASARHERRQSRVAHPEPDASV